MALDNSGVDNPFAPSNTFAFSGMAAKQQDFDSLNKSLDEFVKGVKFPSLTNTPSLTGSIGTEMSNLFAGGWSGQRNINNEFKDTITKTLSSGGTQASGKSDPYKPNVTPAEDEKLSSGAAAFLGADTVGGVAQNVMLDVVHTAASSINPMAGLLAKGATDVAVKDMNAEDVLAGMGLTLLPGGVIASSVASMAGMYDKAEGIVTSIKDYNNTLADPNYTPQTLAGRAAVARELNRENGEGVFGFGGSVKESNVKQGINLQNLGLANTKNNRDQLKSLTMQTLGTRNAVTEQQMEQAARRQQRPAGQVSQVVANVAATQQQAAQAKVEKAPAPKAKTTGGGDSSKGGQNNGNARGSDSRGNQMSSGGGTSRGGGGHFAR